MRTVVASIAAIAAFVLVFCGLPAPASADGLVVIDCPTAGVPTLPPPGGRSPLPPTACPAYLTVKNHNVTVSIDNQIARTHVDQTFVNDSAYSLEGTYLFPLPIDAAITDFAMWVDGKKLEGKVLDRNQARQIYEDIVRRKRDPALLEYVGGNAFQARIFPIPPHTEKRVEMDYSQVLKAEGGLVRYAYPLNTEKFSPKPLERVSVTVAIHSNAALKAIYSPSHVVAVSRNGEFEARVGYEASNVKPDQDFVLYYSVAPEDIGLNLLTFRSGTEDGFFLLLVAPRVNVPTTQVIAKDVILVLDTSGSMQGAKIEQAKRALNYVLDQLGNEDRFNIISFSTGTSAYARSLRPVSARNDARNFVAGLKAEGSTDINRALLEALSYVDRNRPTTTIFLTDGLPTAGEVNSEKIIANVKGAASKNARLFTFGVGDDVNTVLLDRLAEQMGGASSYVRPNERIDEVVSAFYAKVSTPVLSGISIDWGAVAVSDIYPYPMPDLFAGTQLVIAGRYRNGGPTSVTLQGVVNGVTRSFKYSDVSFRTAGGDDMIPRLWATRKIGYLLNQIRLHGENRESIDEIVSLAIRYGIVTPYTSFLIDERQDVLSREGRGGAAESLSSSFAPGAMPTSGAAAVQHSQDQSNLYGANVAPTAAAKSSGSNAGGAAIQTVRNKTFVLRNGTWTDTQYDPSKMKTTKIEFNSEAYYAFLANRPALGPYLALGVRVIVLDAGAAFEITDDGSGISAPSALPTPGPKSLIPKAGPVATSGDGTMTAGQHAIDLPVQKQLFGLEEISGGIGRGILGIILIGSLALGTWIKI